MRRRDFLLSGVAVATAGTGLAQSGQPTTFALPEEFRPRRVRMGGGLPPNQVHVVPREFALYWTLPDDLAIRFAVGIGRPGLYEAGTFYVGAKREWPAWTPTPEMIAREPHIYKRWAGGMPGGPGNPLGARALYLYQEGRGDTYLRIHGTSDPRGIGREVSNGCARLVNAHVIQLYGLVPRGATVVLHPKG